MAITLKKIESLKKQFKNLHIEVVATTEDGKKVDAFTIVYQKHGLMRKLSPGLREVNALWDERQARPNGYIVVHVSEMKNGNCISIMVSEEFYRAGAKNGVLDAKIAEWVSGVSA